MATPFHGATAQEDGLASRQVHLGVGEQEPV